MTCSCTCKCLWYIVNGQWNRIDSVTGWCQVDLTPLMHVMEQRSKEKLSWHWSHPIASLYGIPFFSLSIDASLLKTLVAALPVPPVDDRTKGSYLCTSCFCWLFWLIVGLLWHVTGLRGNQLVDGLGAILDPPMGLWSALRPYVLVERMFVCWSAQGTGSAVSFQIGCPGGSWPVSAGMRGIADSSGRKTSEVDSAFTSMTCKK